MRSFTHASIALLLLTCTALPLSAPLSITEANAGMYDQTPLVIVRFNQRNVYYEKPLYNAVTRALQTKPSVKFEIVAYAPQLPNETSLNERMMEATETYAAEVLASLKAMGIPEDRVTYAMEASDTARSSEVHVFVR